MIAPTTQTEQVTGSPARSERQQIFSIPPAYSVCFAIAENPGIAVAAAALIGAALGLWVKR